MEATGHILSSGNSNYSDSENDDWIPTAASQSTLDDEISDDFNGTFRNSAVKILVNYI